MVGLNVNSMLKVYSEDGLATLNDETVVYKREEYRLFGILFKVKEGVTRNNITIQQYKPKLQLKTVKIGFKQESIKKKRKRKNEDKDKIS